MPHNSLREERSLDCHSENFYRSRFFASTTGSNEDTNPLALVHCGDTRSLESRSVQEDVVLLTVWIDITVAPDAIELLFLAHENVIARGSLRSDMRPLTLLSLMRQGKVREGIYRRINAKSRPQG